MITRRDIAAWFISLMAGECVAKAQHVGPIMQLGTAALQAGAADPVRLLPNGILIFKGNVIVRESGSVPDPTVLHQILMGLVDNIAGDEDSPVVLEWGVMKDHGGTQQ